MHNSCHRFCVLHLVQLAVPLQARKSMQSLLIVHDKWFHNRDPASDHTEQAQHNTRTHSYLEVQTCEQSHTTVDPMCCWHLRQKLNIHNKVGGMACGRQGACTCQSLVCRTLVDLLIRCWSMLYRPQPYHRHRREQFFGT